MLSEDELALAIESLARKLGSARRMVVVATVGRAAMFTVMLAAGFAILIVGPAPFLELMEGTRVLATTWDVFAWWIAVLIVASFVGALMVQASRRRRRRAEGWKHRVADLERRLADARRVQAGRAGL